MYRKRVLVVTVAVLFIALIIGNIYQNQRYKEIVNRVESSINGSLSGLYQFAKSYDADEHRAADHYDWVTLNRLIEANSFRNSIVRGSIPSHYVYVEDIAFSYRLLMGYMEEYGRIEPILILNQNLRRYLEPLDDLIGMPGVGAKDYDKFLKEFAETIDDERRSEDDMITGYHSETLPAIRMVINRLPEILEEEGYERID